MGNHNYDGVSLLGVKSELLKSFLNLKFKVNDA